MENVHILNEFLKVMTPIVPPGRIALEVVGSPRRHQRDMHADMINVAKRHKLHRKTKHAQSAIVLSYVESENKYLGPSMVLAMHGETRHVRRLVIIAVLFVTLMVIVSK